MDKWLPIFETTSAEGANFQSGEMSFLVFWVILKYLTDFHKTVETCINARLVYPN